MSRDAIAARHLLEANRPADAVRTIIDALSTSPDDAELHGLLAQANIVLGRPQEALSSASRAAALDPENEWPHRLRSIALRQLGRKADSILAAKESVRLEPSLAVTHQMLGEAYLANGNVDEAYAEGYEARRLDPSLAGAYDLLGRCLLRQRRVRDAESSFRYALQLEPDHAMAHNNLGVALERQGRRVDAVHEFNAAAKLDPSSDLARKNVLQGTQSLLGGGLAFVLIVAALRLAVVAQGIKDHNLFLVIVPLGFLGLAGWWLIRHRPVRKSRLPESAVSYYEAEKRRGRPILLLRVGSVVVAVAFMVLGLALQSGGVMLLGAFLAVLLFALAPRLWQRIARR